MTTTEIWRHNAVASHASRAYRPNWLSLLEVVQTIRLLTPWHHAAAADALDQRTSHCSNATLVRVGYSAAELRMYRQDVHVNVERISERGLFARLYVHSL